MSVSGYMALTTLGVPKAVMKSKCLYNPHHVAGPFDGKEARQDLPPWGFPKGKES